MASNEAVVGVLRALLTLDSAEFDNGLRKVSKSFKSVEKEWGTLGRKMTTLGTQLTKALTLPIVGAGTAAAKFAIDFEDSFAGVRKTVDATEAEFAQLEKGLRGLSKVIPINVNELNKIAESAGQLGIETKNIVGFTETMAKLGVTTNLSAEDAATSLARLANITGMPQTEFERLGSTIVDLGNNFATTESEIVDFGLRIAGAGKIAGLTEHQILAIGAAMSSVGVEAEAGGTAVQKVLNGMTEAVALGGKQLEIFAATAGMSASQFAAAFREDAAGAFNAFVVGLGKSGDDAFRVLDGLSLGNERVIRAFLSLANAGDLLTRTLDTSADAWRENSALSEEAAKRFETTRSQLTLLWNNLKDVGITIGNALLPMIKSANETLQAWIPTLERAAKWFAELDPSIQKAGVALGLFLAALGPAAFVFGQAALTISSIAGAFTTLGIQATVAKAAIGFIPGALALIVVPLALERVVELFQQLAGLYRDAQQWRKDDAADSFAHARAMEEASKLSGRSITNLDEALQILRDHAAELRAQNMPGILAGTTAVIAKYAPAAEDAATATGEVADQGSRLADVLNEATDETKKLNEAYQQLMSDMRNEQGLAQMERDLFEIEQRMTEFKWPNLADEVFHDWDAEWRHVTATIGNLPDTTKEAADAAAQRWIEAMTEAGIKTPDTLIGPPSVWKQTLENTLASIQADLGNVILGALMGGGDVGRAAGGFIGGEFGKHFQKPVADAISGVFGSTIGGALGSFLPGIGTIAGSFIGKGLQALFNIGGPSQQELEGREVAANFRQGLLDGLSEAQMAEVRKAVSSGAWDSEDAAATVVAIRDVYLQRGRSVEDVLDVVNRLNAAEKEGGEAVLAVQREIRAVMDELAASQDAQAQKQQMLDDAVQRYGFSLEELPEKMRNQELAAQAEGLLNDFDLLTEAGFGVGTVIDRMGESLNEFIQRAVATGTEVPEQFRPILEQMLDMGTLVDENGNKLESLEGITFGDELVDQFSMVLQKLNELIDAIKGVPRAIETEWQVRTPNFDELRARFPQGGMFGGVFDEAFRQFQGQIPSFAHEAKVSAPTFAMIGDAPEPEYVLRESTLRGLSDGGGDSQARFFSRLQGMFAEQKASIERGVIDALSTSQWLPQT